jgi:periplasmic protein TonB
MAMRVLLTAILALIVSGLATSQTNPGSQSSPPSQVVAGPVVPVYRVGGDVKPPRAIDAPDPKLTQEEKKQSHKTKFKGVATLLIVVSEDGLVSDVRVTRSLGSYLDGKAVEAVKAWTFEPGTKQGKAVPVQIAVEVNFRLY